MCSKKIHGELRAYLLFMFLSVLRSPQGAKIFSCTGSAFRVPYVGPAEFAQFTEPNNPFPNENGDYVKTNLCILFRENQGTLEMRFDRSRYQKYGTLVASINASGFVQFFVDNGTKYLPCSRDFSIWDAYFILSIANALLESRDNLAAAHNINPKSLIPKSGVFIRYQSTKHGDCTEFYPVFLLRMSQTGKSAVDSEIGTREAKYRARVRVKASGIPRQCF